MAHGASGGGQSGELRRVAIESGRLVVGWLVFSPFRVCYCRNRAKEAVLGRGAKDGRRGQPRQTEVDARRPALCTRSRRRS